MLTCTMRWMLLMPPNRAGRYIFVMWFLSSFFVTYSQRSEIGCLPYFHTWCGLSTNLECMFDMCCASLTENTRTQKLHKEPPSGHHRTTSSGYIFATKARIDNRRNLLNSNISSTCPLIMVNFGPLAAEIDWQFWGTPANFNWFCILAFLLHWRRSTEVSRTLCVV